MASHTRRVFDDSESPRSKENVKSSMSDNYQAALNVEVPLPGGLGFRPCLTPCFFQLAIAGCNNKASEFPRLILSIAHSNFACVYDLKGVVSCRYFTTRREVLKLGSLGIGLGSSYFALTHLKVRPTPQFCFPDLFKNHETYPNGSNSRTFRILKNASCLLEYLSSLLLQSQ